MYTSRLYVISAPSGTGKTTIRREIEKLSVGVKYSISCTTRKPRIGEKEGIDYFFISEAEFESRVRKGQFLEWAVVFGNYYGTDKLYVEKLMSEGHDVVLDIDVKGASQVKARVRDVITIFILPPSMEVLRERLAGRKTESEEALNSRLDEAKKEIMLAAWYDYIVVNDVLEEAVQNIVSIFRATRCKRENSLRLLDRFPGY